jgi:L-tryptophan--pyruvate aminotransferase
MMRYQPAAGTEALKSAIIELHSQVKNAKTDGRQVVVGAGATQVLIAALRAYANKGAKLGFAKEPYFFRFPSFFHLSGLQMVKRAPSVVSPLAPVVEILTLPKNPTAEVYSSDSESAFVVHDLCYNWPTYTECPVEYDAEVMVFGLSKTTGHASTRMGWALVKDPEVAALMNEYVECSSSGVSIEAQIRSTDILVSQVLRASLGSETAFNFGKRILSERWERLSQFRSDRFIIENASGMFAWVRVPGEVGLEFFRMRGIAGADGSLCGGTDEHVRLNIGCSNDVFEKLLVRLSQI